MHEFVIITFDTNEFGKEYLFRNDIPDLTVGDKVVLDTQYGFSVGTIRGFEEHEPDHIKVSKFIVQKIDTASHAERLRNHAYVQEIKGKLEARRKQLEDATIYALLAQQDPEMKNLLEIYNSIS
ncbi:hypothetical protein [Bacillus altitudinis]|uniref:hypothetical protein n=1 Tax=Bacillus altitudinis TaxID=293387 RepID=UPI002100A0E5|nr:hypothetical protein [Bacillus altitudinis]UTV34858.1 hypothetical protein NM966_19890 [Bacillus altitudinis]